MDIEILLKRMHFEFDNYRNPTQTQWTITYILNHDFQHKMAAYNFMIHSMVTTPPNKERKQKETKYILENGHTREIVIRIQKKLRHNLETTTFHIPPKMKI